MQTFTSQLFTITLSLFWFLILFWSIFLSDASIQSLVLSLFSLCALSLMALRGTSTFSATSGKILIVMSVFVTLSLLFAENITLINPSGIIPVAALATGLYIERVNPHRRLHAWMVLGISTKVQIVLVTAMTTIDASMHPNTHWWWLTVVCLGTSVLLLVFHNLFWYRIMVALTSVVTFGLTVMTLSTSAGNLVLTTLVLTAFCWPMIMMRAVGRKVFPPSLF